MNWYFKTILAQIVESPGLAGYLERINASPEIIDYIISLDAKPAQILTNEFRKNPNLTLQQLQQVLTLYQ